MRVVFAAALALTVAATASYAAMKVGQRAPQLVGASVVGSIALNAGTTSSRAQIQGGVNAGNLRIYNAGAVPVFVNCGAAAVTASLTTSMPIAPGSVAIIGCSQLFLAAVTASGAATLHLSGDGLATIKRPADIVPFSGFFGLRAYSRAQCTGTVNAIELRRASDSATQNITINTACDLDVAAASTFCSATTCFVRTVYDQVSQTGCGGLPCNLLNNTPANQPEFVFNCINARPCIRTANNSSMLLSSANQFAPATDIVSLYAVAGRTVGVGGCTFVTSNGTTGNRISSTATTFRARLAGTTSTLDSGELTSAMHVLIGVVNGASSIISSDGVDRTGSVTGSTASGAPVGFRGAVSTTCDAVEIGFVDNVALTDTRRRELVNLVQMYWGL